MKAGYFEPDGELVDIDHLVIEKVRDLAFMLDAGKIPL